MRRYTLFCSGFPSRTFTNKSVNYRHGMWIITIIAGSIKQAYALALNEAYSDGKSIGIVHANNAERPIWKGTKIPVECDGYVRDATERFFKSHPKETPHDE